MTHLDMLLKSIAQNPKHCIINSTKSGTRVSLTAKCNDHTRPYIRSLQLAARGPHRSCNFTRDVRTDCIDDTESKICVNPVGMLANQKQESALTMR